MCRLSVFFGALAFVAFPGCTPSPVEPVPPGLPLALASVAKDATNAGRVQSIAVNPTNKNHAIIAMEFGGLWKTHSGGSSWFRVESLPAVFVTDVEFGSDGRTVVATVFRDNQVINGGGIYVSQDSGDNWTRPQTGLVPVSHRTPARTSGYSVSHAPDERGLWYAGTDYGVAISRDNGATWNHVSPDVFSPEAASRRDLVEDDHQQDAAQSVLALPGGRVLSMTRKAVEQSDDRGMSWRKVIEDDFSQEGPGGGAPGNGSNKMDRSPYASWAFIFRDYGPKPRVGTLWFYELDTDTKTKVPLPQGKSRGPFVRVSKDKVFGGQHITIWVGAGWDGYFVTRDSAPSIRAIRSDPEWDDWVSFIAPAGIHADMSDMGVDGDLQPAFFGSDGGIFKPHPNKPGRLISAAVPGSGMNSLQITDLAGTNVTGSSGRVTTHLYFTTQDNKIWASPDGGQTWPHSDDQEGYGLEGRADARSGEQITFGYRAIGRHAREARFADALLGNSRPVPDVDDSGRPLSFMGLPFFLARQASPTAKPSFWVRLRQAPGAAPEVYASGNSGANWRKTGNLNFSPAGEIKRTAGGVYAWLPVNTGGTDNRIGLVPLAPTADTIQTYDDSDVVRLPGNGGLGKRATMFDWHAVFGVHPLDWKFLLAPDISSNDIKVSRDGGNSWAIDIGLTKQVLRGGALKLWDDNPYRMQVTQIAFDPYWQTRYGNRIFVGTRDAGIVCSGDSGRSWRTIKHSDKIKYITGFHFLPNGAVYVSSYGHGLWYVKPAQGCPDNYDLPWDMEPAIFDKSAENTGAIARVNDMPPPPRGIPDPSVAKLFLIASVPASGVTVLGLDNHLAISGRSFPPDKEVSLTIRGSELLKQKVQVDKNGQLLTNVVLPEDLPFGMYTIEAALERECGPLRLTSADFVKGYSDVEVRRAGE